MGVGALSAADSGISTMQTEIDAVGNNVANADTDGYQETDPEFENILTEQLTSASAPTSGLASTNPSAIGAGAQVAGMQTDFGQGAIVQTGVATDAAIQGNGFFVVDEDGSEYYTRAGDFQLDEGGVLATQGGAIVQGWTGTNPTTGPTGAITIPNGETIAPQETANITLGGNVPAGGSAFTATATLYDAQGNPVPLTLTYTPTGTANQWVMQASVNGQNLFASGVTMNFGTNGQLLSYSVDGGVTASVTGQTSIATTEALPTGFSWDETSLNLVVPSPSSTSAVTQFASSGTVGVTAQDGYPQGVLESWSIGENGVITGTFSNGESQQLGTVALANFANPEGLVNLGNLLYQTSAASGQPELGTPGTNGRGTLLGGSLEQSNVDLAGELTNLVEAQTDYEANTKVISTVQSSLQSLVNSV